MPLRFFGQKKLQRLESADDIDSVANERVVVLDKKTGDVGLTLGNTCDGEGVVVVSVSSTGIAAKHVTAGAIILKINAHPVGTHSEAVALIDKAANGIVELVLSADMYDAQSVETGVPKMERSTSQKSMME